MKSRRYAGLLVLSALIVAGFLLYYRALGAPWYLDDFGAIVQNRAIRTLALPDTLSLGARPLSYLSFALNYQLTGLDPFAFRVVNLCIHIAGSFLVFLLLRLFFPGRFWAAAAGALLFLAHPVQTQAVSYVVQRMATLSGFFFLLAVYSYCRYRLRQQARIGEGGSGPGVWLAGAGLAFVCAVFSKENAITLPAVLLALDLVYFRKAPWRNLPHARILLPVLAVGLAAALVKLSAGFVGSYEASKTYYYVQRPGGGLDLLLAAPDQVRLQYLFTQFIAIWEYVLLFFLPVGQMLDYGYPLVDRLANPRSIAGLAAIVAALAVAWRCRKGHPLITIGILWFFITLSVESSFFPLDPFFEHRLYLPCFGLILLLLELCRTALDHVTGRLVAVILLVLLSLLTVRRNALWADPLDFWADNVVKAPHNFRPKSHLATELAEAGRYAEALPLQQQVVAAVPSQKHYVNLGRTYMKLGDFRSAAEVFALVVQSGPAAAENFLNYSIVLGAAGDYRAALAQAEKAYALEPRDVRVLTNLGIAHARVGNRGEAETFLRRALQIDPGNAVAARNLDLLLRQGAGR